MLAYQPALSVRWRPMGTPDIDDAGMANISTLTQMVDLTLRGTALTDGGLPNFFTRLRRYFFRRPKNDSSAPFAGDVLLAFPGPVFC